MGDVMEHLAEARRDPGTALVSLRVITNDQGMSKPAERPLAELGSSSVSRGPDGAVRFGPVWSGEGVAVIQGVVAPGGYMADHAGDGQLFVLVRSGEGAFTTRAADGTSAEVACGPGDVVLVELGAEHGFRADGDAPVTFLAIQIDEAIS